MQLFPVHYSSFHSAKSAEDILTELVTEFRYDFFETDPAAQSFVFRRSNLKAHGIIARQSDGSSEIKVHARFRFDFSTVIWHVFLILMLVGLVGFAGLQHLAVRMFLAVMLALVALAWFSLVRTWYNNTKNFLSRLTKVLGADSGR